jgi:hypothetical protein
MFPIWKAGLALRRDLTKGQKAMAMALLYPEPERGRGKKDPAKKEAETASFSYRRVKQARQVLAYSRELALAVRDGTKSLDEASQEGKSGRDLPRCSHNCWQAQLDTT